MLSILTELLSHVFLLFGYISNNNLFPEPLSKTEEEYYLRRYFEGDKEAKNKLIEHNLRLVAHIAKRYASNEQELDELISIGSIGLIKAINSFKEEKNFKISTYASRCIENEILMYLRRNNRIKNEVSFDEPLNIDWDGNELLLSDILGTENDEVYHHIEEEVNYNLLSYVMKKLSPREKVIMEMRFGLVNGEEMTQKEVADEIGISQSYISRLEKKIISRMQKEIKKLG